MLHEADGGGKVVEEPGEAAIIEVDYAETRAVDEKIGQPQIGVDEAEPVVSVSVGIETLLECIGDPLQQFSAIFAKTKAGVPIAPQRSCAQHCIKIPDLALKVRRPLPSAAMCVKPGTDRAEFAEPGNEMVRWIGLLGAEILEFRHLV